MRKTNYVTDKRKCHKRNNILFRTMCISCQYKHMVLKHGWIRVNCAHNEILKKYDWKEALTLINDSMNHQNIRN